MENPAGTQSQDVARILGETRYLCRILRILVSDRVDLSVGCSRIKVSFQEGLEISIGALEMKLSPRVRVFSL